MDAQTHVDAPGGARSLFGNRREYLINRRYQLGGAALAFSVAMLLLVALNLAFFAWASSTSASVLADSPELEAVVKAQDRAQIALTVLASVVFLGGVFAVGILESHRTAGAAFHIERCLREVRDGRFATQVALRRNDHLRELQSAFNQMTQSMRSEALHDIDTLEVAIAALGSSGDAALADTAESLRAMAREKRRHLR